MTMSIFSVTLTEPMPKMRRALMMPMPRSSMKWRILSGAEPTRVLAGHPADFHRVVGDQAVAALDQLNGRFAFAHAAVSQQEDALAVDLHKHAVAGDAGGQAAR